MKWPNNSTIDRLFSEEQSRRGFIQTLGVAGASLALGKLARGSEGKEDALSFLASNPDIFDEAKIMDIERYGVPLESKGGIGYESRDYDEAVALGMKYADLFRPKHHSKGAYSVLIESECYAFPEIHENAKRLLDYATKGQEYYNSQMPDMPSSLEWIALHDGDAYRINCLGRGFLGLNYASKYTYTATHEEREDQVFDFSVVLPKTQPLYEEIYNEEGFLGSYSYARSGRYGLIEPFVMMANMAAGPAARKHDRSEDSVGGDGALWLFSMSVGAKLAHEFASHPTGDTLIDQVFREYERDFPVLGKAKDWLRHNTPNKAARLFKKSPLEYLYSLSHINA
jgi:hypothetical protein